MPKTYSWKTTSGVWSTPANWIDQTLLKDPALTPPGPTDTALFSGTTARQLAGGGVAGTASLSGGIDLSGGYSFLATNADLLGLRDGSTLTTGSAYLNIGMVAGPGARIDATGTLSTAALAALNGGTVTAGTLVLRSFSQGIFTTGAVRLDPVSAIVVGAPGTATPGAIALNGGTIDARGITFDAPITGTGTLLASAIATPIPSGVTVAMSFGDQGYGPYSIALPLAGFDGTLVGLPGTVNTTQFDHNTAIIVPGHSVTGATYTETGLGLGTLALTGAAGTIETIRLAGTYAGDSFIALPFIQSGVATTRIQPTDIVLPGTTTGELDLPAYPVALAGTHVAAGVTVNDFNAPVAILPGATLTAFDTNITNSGMVVSGAGATFRGDGTIALGFIDSFRGVFSNQTSFSVLNGGTAQSFFTVYLKNSDALIRVDSLSSFEAGQEGGAAIGAFTIDETIPVLGVGTIEAAVVNNGSLIARPGTYEVAPLVVTGPITGTGELQVSANATLALRGSVGPGNTVELLGQGSVLDLSAGAPMQAAIAGLTPGASILLLPAAVTGATLAAGTIALTGAEGAAGSLNLPGGLPANQSLLLLPGAPSTLLAANGTLLAGPAPNPSPGNAINTALSWVAQGGNWADTANWIDLATSQAPAAPAGFGDAVVIGGSITPLQVISGAGNAGILQIKSNVAFSGVFNTVSLTVGAAGALTTALAPGTTLTAQQASVEWRMAVTNATFAVAGTYTMFGPTSLEATSGAHVTLAAVATGGSGTPAQAITIDALSSVEIGSAGSAPAGFLTVDAGATLAVGTLVRGAVNNNGRIANLATIDGSVTGTGHIALAPGGRLAITGAIAAGQTIDFAAGAETLTLGGPVHGHLANLGAGDVLAFSNTLFDTATYTPTGVATGTLALTQRGTLVQAVTLDGNYAGQLFLARPTDTTTTAVALVAAAVPCFAQGTTLLTPRGEIPVEQLRPGDHLLTASGRAAPIRWIGRRRLDCRRHRRPEDVLPIRIAPHAFAPDRPARDLYLSPDHAVFHDGVLIPIRYLVNGRSIARCRVRTVTYFHVELDRHDVILAHALPCESYLDTGNRAAFTPGGRVFPPEHARTVWTRSACAPLVLSGPELLAARRALHVRAGATTTAPALAVSAAGRLLSVHRDGPRHRVHLPPACGPIRLRSRIWVPAEMRPDEHDPRPLGVALANLVLDGRPIPLDDPRLSSGWHAPEPGWRWTNGNAGLALAGITTLEFDLVLAGTYACENTSTARSANARYSAA